MNETWDSDEESSYSNYNAQTKMFSNRERGQGDNRNWRTRDRSFSKERYSRHRNDTRNDENYLDNSSQKSITYIDSHKVGKLIGKGGSKIKELENLSNAKIRVTKSSDDSTTTAVTLHGSNDAQEKAKKLISELLNESSVAKPVEKEINIKENNISETNEEVDWIEAKKIYEQCQREKWAKYPPIIKNFYIEDPAVANMTKEQVAQFRKFNNNIEVQYVFKDEGNCDNIPNPVQTFEQAFSNYPEILEEIRKQNFEKPSPIQCQAWPVLLSGKDLIGIAQTGTGKTLAFLLPALIHIDGQTTPLSERSGPNVLIMAPTRELALQIEKEINKYSYKNIKAVCVYGGGNRKEQIATVLKGVQIVIATPGRLNDLVRINVLDVSSVTYLVLDEADRMLDMGFEPQIRLTLLNVRPDRQTVMTSATWPQDVRRLAESYTKNPVQIFVGSLDLAVVHTVMQEVYIVDENEKTDILTQFFHEMGPNDKVIVFIGKKNKVDDIASDLALVHIDCESIHGGRDQEDREQALEYFTAGNVRILLATDVVSRGLDIDNVTHVFNYDFPRDIEEYVHRVGRTGRAGRSGKSITLMTRNDWSRAKDLIKILEEANQEIPQDLYSMAERYEQKKLQRNSSGTSRRGGGSSRYSWMG